MKYQGEKHSYKNRVCGMEMSQKTAAFECTYNNKAYYFCADVCLKEFETDPEKYIHHH